MKTSAEERRTREEEAVAAGEGEQRLPPQAVRALDRLRWWKNESARSHTENAEITAEITARQESRPAGRGTRR